MKAMSRRGPNGTSVPGASRAQVNTFTGASGFSRARSSCSTGLCTTVQSTRLMMSISARLVFSARCRMPASPRKSASRPSRRKCRSTGSRITFARGARRRMAARFLEAAGEPEDHDKVERVAVLLEVLLDGGHERRIQALDPEALKVGRVALQKQVVVLGHERDFAAERLEHLHDREHHEGPRVLVRLGRAVVEHEDAKTHAAFTRREDGLSRLELLLSRWRQRACSFFAFSVWWAFTPLARSVPDVAPSSCTICDNGWKTTD